MIHRHFGGLISSPLVSLSLMLLAQDRCHEHVPRTRTALASTLTVPEAHDADAARRLRNRRKRERKERT
jgi:hypothetical protein